jgi:hypothetical protein
MADERRDFQRLKLAKPLLALLDGHNALILDVGVAGAFIEHYGRLQPGARVRLTFRWQANDVEFVCVTTRSAVVREDSKVVSQTGLRFVEGVGDATTKLQEMMATFVGQILVAQKANASAGSDSESDTLLPKIGGARRGRSTGLLTYRFNGKTWSRARSSSPAQPQDGFTVAAYEDEEELDILCRAYEEADSAGRQMIRVIAELSARSVKEK